METLKRMADEELVKAYSLGNNSAFDCLLMRHKKSIYNYIFFIVKSREITEDIFQDAFVKAITTIKQGKYVETGKFKAWITRIAHNLIIDYFRQEKKENTVSNDEQDIDLFNNASLCDDTIEDVIILAQIHSDVRKLIMALPENQREVLEMRYYRKMSFKEISDITGVSINTALGRMRYALLNMRKLAEENNVILTFQ